MPKKEQVNTSLVPKSELDITPQQEQDMKVDILEDIDKTSLVELRKQDIAKKSQLINLETKENSLEAVETINKNIADLTELIADPKVLERVMEGIATGKDYNEAVKAVNGLIDLRNKQLDQSIDPYATTGKKKKLEVMFKSQGVQVAARVEVDK